MVRYFDNATAADARQAACDATWWTLPISGFAGSEIAQLLNALEATDAQARRILDAWAQQDGDALVEDKDGQRYYYEDKRNPVSLIAAINAHA
jgi:hypothetical protein